MDHDTDLQSDSPTISWPINRPAQRRSFSTPNRQSTTTVAANTNTFPSTEIFPGGKKALDGIALRAFILGVAFGFFTLSTVLLAYLEYQVWRAPFFLASLALFHFLEYFITAAYNTPAADIMAFLLSQNGKAYNIAHTAALTECVITSYFFPRWQAGLSTPRIALIGLLAMVIGQIIRSVAMAHAGTNFNHTVQTRKATGHKLVTDGIYKYLRHPSYFGFFWWGLGTQLVLGNLICFLAYTLILWKFFSHRIRKEEELLVMFFGDEYETYRARVRVGIPFIA